MKKFGIVIVSPPGYIHSWAFAEVGVSLAWGLRRLGHNVTVGEEPEPGRRSIILGANLLEHVRWTPPANSIIYNLEQIDPTSIWLTPHFLKTLARYEVWDYSPQNATQYAALKLPPPTRILPIGYCPDLERIKPAARQDIDVLFFGSLNERRIGVLNELLRNRIIVRTVTSYGWMRDHMIARSKIVLNLHYYESKVFEIVRVSYLLTNGACVVSEGAGQTPDEAPFHEGVAFAPYEALVERSWALLTDETERARIAARGHAAMTARPMDALLRLALEGAPDPLPDPKSPPRPLGSEGER